MIKTFCDICKRELKYRDVFNIKFLKSLNGSSFVPLEFTDNGQSVIKHDLCYDCYNKVIDAYEFVVKNE
jgi:hypothetical protein